MACSCESGGDSTSKVPFILFWLTGLPGSHTTCPKGTPRILTSRGEVIQWLISSCLCVTCVSCGAPDQHGVYHAGMTPPEHRPGVSRSALGSGSAEGLRWSAKLRLDEPT
jgi:hypothetical protein